MLSALEGGGKRERGREGGREGGVIEERGWGRQKGGEEEVGM